MKTLIIGSNGFVGLALSELSATTSILYAKMRVKLSKTCQVFSSRNKAVFAI